MHSICTVSGRTARTRDEEQMGKITARTPYKRRPNLSPQKVARIKARRLAGQKLREIAEAEGSSTQTIHRIVTQDEHKMLTQSYRDIIATEILPEAVKSLAKLIKEADRTAVIETLYGMKVFVQRNEIETVQAPERDYADAKVEFYYKYGRWPTLEEAKKFDQT